MIEMEKAIKTTVTNKFCVEVISNRLSGLFERVLYPARFPTYVC